MKCTSRNFRWSKLDLGVGIRAVCLRIQPVGSSPPHFLLLFVLWSLVGLLISPDAALGAPFQGKKFAVASPSPYSAGVASEVAALGGNTFDQAVAIGLALSVTHPYYAALGGGGFAVVRKSTSATAASYDIIDFRETAPGAAARDTFIGRGPKAATDGGLASGVPGYPAGLFALHKKYGKLKWKQLFGPAVRLAEKGFPVSGDWARLTAEQFGAFNGAGKRAFGRKLKADPADKREVFEPLTPGDILKQPNLAKALKILRDQGIKPFYEGALGKDIVETVQQTGGIMNMNDLKSYAVAWREPLRRKWRGFDLILMPPPSSGGLIISQALEIFDRIEKKVGVQLPLSAGEAHLWGESLKLAFAARGKIADPMGTQAMTEVTAQLLDPARLDRLAGLVQLDRAIEVKSSKSPDLKEAMAPAKDNTGGTGSGEKPETTNFSIADEEGNALALTVTLNGSYGSGMVTDKYGIALNDEMDDFTTLPGTPNQYGLMQGEANTVAPGKRPLSSMSPTIVEKDGGFAAVLGAPGGPRIPSAVFQGLVRLLAQGADAEEAVTQPRVHHQFMPDTLFFDARRFAPEVVTKLKSFGHSLQESWHAKLYVVRKTKEGYLEAAGDPRGEAAAGGR